MNTTKLVLADNTEIELQEGAALGYMKTHYENNEAMISDWNKLTIENLKVMHILVDDVIIGNYTDMILENETSVLHEDGSIDTIWNIREKTETEKLKEEIVILKQRQEMPNENTFVT